MQDLWATVVALAEDRDLGATDTTIQAALAVRALARSDVADAMETLLRGHPCMAPLWRLAAVLLWERNHASVVDGFLESLRDHTLAAEAVARSLPERIVTVSWSATVARAIELRRPRTVVCMASEPGGEGDRMAGAIRHVTDAIVMTDDDVLRDVPGEAVLVGADAITPRSVVNKVKTCGLVEAAQDRGVPRYAVAGTPKLVPVELPVVQPFERTPIEAFTQVATPSGLLDPVLAGARAAAVGLHPALVVLAEVLERELPQDDVSPN